MKATKFILVLFLIVMGFTSCTGNDDDIAGQELNGLWFLVQLCNGDNEECIDIERGSYIFNFDHTNGTVVIEKDGTIFRSFDYEIKKDALFGSLLYIDGQNRGRLVTLTSGSLVLRNTQINFLGPNLGGTTTISYYVR